MKSDYSENYDIYLSYRRGSEEISRRFSPFPHECGFCDYLWYMFKEFGSY